MDWRRLDRWATIATISLYVAAAASLVIILGETLLPAGTPARVAFHDIANYLNRLGDIGGGAIIVIILFILAGGGTAMLLINAYDKFQEIRRRRAQERQEMADAIAESRAEGRAEGRAEILDQLRKSGVDVDDFVPPEDADSEPSGAN